MFIINMYLLWRLYDIKCKSALYESLLNIIENSKGFYYYCHLKPTMTYRYISPTVDRYLGPGGRERHMQNPYDELFRIIHPDDERKIKEKMSGEIDFSEPFTIRLMTQTGEYRWYEDYVTPVYEDNELVAIHGIYWDIHDKMIMQQTLQFKLMHDQLTNMKNRTYFEEQLSYYNEKQDKACGIIICDLDDLKIMNDTKGHKMGDYYIKEGAAILSQVMNNRADVCRIGGDEFAIIIAETTAKEVADLVTAINKKVKQFNEQNQLHIKMSIGHRFSEHSIGKMDTLFVEADQEMYKQKYKNKRL